MYISKIPGMDRRRLLYSLGLALVQLELPTVALVVEAGPEA